MTRGAEKNELKCKGETIHIPMKFKVTRIISVAFIELLICCLEARYASMTEIKKPFRQS